VDGSFRCDGDPREPVSFTGRRVIGPVLPCDNVATDAPSRPLALISPSRVSVPAVFVVEPAEERSAGCESSGRTRRSAGRTPLEGTCRADTGGSGARSAPGFGAACGPIVGGATEDRARGQAEGAVAEAGMTALSGARPEAGIHRTKRRAKFGPNERNGLRSGAMLLIAAGIALALVAMDFLDLTKIRRS